MSKSKKAPQAPATLVEQLGKTEEQWLAEQKEKDGSTTTLKAALFTHPAMQALDAALGEIMDNAKKESNVTKTEQKKAKAPKVTPDKDEETVVNGPKAPKSKKIAETLEKHNSAVTLEPSTVDRMEREAAALARAVLVERCKVLGISLTDDAGERKTSKVLEQEIEEMAKAVRTLPKDAPAPKGPAPKAAPKKAKKAPAQPDSTVCVACGGKGKSSKGKPCDPCKGTGTFQPVDMIKQLQASLEMAAKKLAAPVEPAKPAPSQAEITAKVKETREKIEARNAMPLATKGTLRKLLRETIKKFPRRFLLTADVAKTSLKGVVLTIDRKRSSIDADTGEEKLALVDFTGEVRARVTPVWLNEHHTKKGVRKQMKKAEKSQTTEAVGEETPKGKKPKKAKQKKPHVIGSEGNIPLMGRLLVEGKTDAEILEVFTKRYTGEEVEHKKDAAWIQGRVHIYKKIAMKDEDVAAAVAARPKAKKAKETPAKKETKAEPAPKGGKKAAKAEKGSK